MIVSIIRRTTEGLLHLFYPQLCVSCEEPLYGSEKGLCLHCILKLPRTGFHCHADNRAARIFTGRLPVEHATAFLYFTKDGMVQELLHALKYKGRKDIGQLLGSLFANELKAVEWIKNVDIIIAVPLHKRKERERGFNQSGVFAAGLAAELGIPYLPGAVIRNRNTRSQTTKSRLERIENVRDVFETVDRNVLQHKHILLIDDVLTTGATLESCAMALLKIAGVKISIATIAVASE